MKNAPIPPSQVSIVVQGPVLESEGNVLGAQHSRRMLDGLRQLLPGSEIVLSTWKGSNHQGLTYDILVESDDPGAWKRGCGRINNVNRQIVSTREGLRACTRQYAVKIRSDCALSHAGFLSCLEAGAPRAERFKLFGERITGCQFFFRDPWKLCLLFHIGDIFHFGLRRDLLDLWDLPLVPGDVGPSFFECLKHGAPRALPYWRRQFRQFEEQHLWTSYLQKRGIEIRLTHPFAQNGALVFDSELSIANNFAIRSPEQLGLLLPSRLFVTGMADATYSHGDWSKLVEIYCDPSRERSAAKRVRSVVRRAVIADVLWGVGRVPSLLRHLKRGATGILPARTENSSASLRDDEWDERS